MNWPLLNVCVCVSLSLTHTYQACIKSYTYLCASQQNKQRKNTTKLQLNMYNLFTRLGIKDTSTVNLYTWACVYYIYCSIFTPKNPFPFKPLNAD